MDKAGPIPPHRPDLGPCWLWTGATNENGYGHVHWEGRTQFAHRVSLALAGRSVPTGHDTDHLCRTHPCVRPEHLEAVLHIENVRRGEAGRYVRRGP